MPGSQQDGTWLQQRSARYSKVRRFPAPVNGRPCWRGLGAGRSIFPVSIVPAELTVLHYPAAALRRRGEPIEIDDTLRAVAQRMLELMHELDGVGLAAPQLGLAWRVFVTRAHDEDDIDRVYVNPQLEHREGELVEREEGCLSLPGVTAQIRRPVSVTIAAQDLDGRTFQLSDSGAMARVWQHEYDHLDGILIIDRMSALDRIATRRAVMELEAPGGR